MNTLETTRRTLLRISLLVLVLSGGTRSGAQPSYENPWTPPVATSGEDARLAAYHARIDEVFDWRIGLYDPEKPTSLDMAGIAMMLVRGLNREAVDARVLELMRDPGTGPFWMFPCTMVAFAGRDGLSAEARGSIRDAWRTTRQLRGDTENHWVMYYVSLYLMSELYPGEAGDQWYTGLSSTENLAESRAWLLEWMDITTTRGQGEYNASHYIGEYAIPMLMLAVWADEPEMRQRGRMMLDWIFAELATVTLDGVLRGPNSRTDDTSVLERWNALSSFFSWILFGNTPPTRGYGGWGNYFAVLARHYEVPEVIHRIATDRAGDILQRDRARTRRFWRYSDELSPPIFKTQYLRKHYAVGSYQGGLSDPIQTHVWDVTWAEPDPRGKHNTIFSLHPHSSGRVQQMYFCTFPEPMPEGVTYEGKPSYNQADKLLGCSPYEQVLQDLDTVVALYSIAPGEDFQQVNGFFSKDLRDVVEHPSGWIFARGGRALLAYRPLAPYEWIAHRHYPSGWSRDTVLSGGRTLVSPHPNNGTIVQAADESEFESYEAFQEAVAALPLEYRLEPRPSVRHRTLRGREIEFAYGRPPMVDGTLVDYDGWKLFEGPHLNAEVGGRRLTITHGRLERVLDFDSLEVVDRVRR
jgi:hypothetical protein